MSLTSKQESIKNRRVALASLQAYNRMIDRSLLERKERKERVRDVDWWLGINIIFVALLITAAITVIAMLGIE